ncbi:maltoporin LamB [Vibrio sp. F74]|uniref:maltoporin LamB n=1 Tax=Vibrio sp. F74 TaxID=700020 RepID=UPI0035F5DAEF
MQVKKTIFSITTISTLLMSVNAIAENDMSYFGYIRGGVGMSLNNGQDVQYNKNQLGRLGNENDTYGEWGIKHEAYNENGVSFDVESMIAAYSDGSTGWETTEDDDLKVVLPQINVQATGLLSSAPEATMWAGKRYYQRHNVDLADFYYWNISGSGAGIENIDFDNGKLSVAWIRTDSDEVLDTGNNSNDLNVNSFDVRFSDIELWNHASLEIGGNYAFTNESSEYEQDIKNGALINIELTQNIGSGVNKTVFQYGTEGYGKTIAEYGDGSWYGAGAKEGANAYRIINWGVVEVGSNWEVGHQLVWSSSVDDISDDQTEDITYLSTVIRPVYKWNENLKTLVEMGYFEKTGISGEKDSGSKLTIAQAWTAGLSYWARPEIRFYGSYFTDNENKNAFGNGKDTEINLGVQAEVWW